MGWTSSMQTAGPVPGRGVWQSWSLRSRFFRAAALALCVTVLMVVLLQSALTSADQQERLHTAFRDVRTSVNAIHANAGSIARATRIWRSAPRPKWPRWSTRPPA